MKVAKNLTYSIKTSVIVVLFLAGVAALAQTTAPNPKNLASQSVGKKSTPKRVIEKAAAPRSATPAAAANLSATKSIRAQPTTFNSAIQHIVFIMKENKTFDNYFGTFPGA